MLFWLWGKYIFPHYLQFVFHLNKKEMASPPQLHHIMLFKDSALIPHQPFLPNPAAGHLRLWDTLDVPTASS